MTAPKRLQYFCLLLYEFADSFGSIPSRIIRPIGVLLDKTPAWWKRTKKQTEIVITPYEAIMKDWNWKHNLKSKSFTVNPIALTVSGAVTRDDWFFLRGGGRLVIAVVEARVDKVVVGVSLVILEGHVICCKSSSGTPVQSFRISIFGAPMQ